MASQPKEVGPGADQKLPDDPMIHYIGTDLSLLDLSRAYKGHKSCSLTNLKRRAAREGWNEKRRKFRSDLAQKTIEKMVEGEAERTARHLKGIKSGQELSLAALAGVAHKIQAIGGVSHFFDDPKMARSLALVLRAGELALRGGIHAERQVVGKRREEMENILEAAAAMEKEVEHWTAPRRGPVPKPDTNGKPEAPAPAPEAVTEGANGGKP